jgi:hypothetical protein
MRTKKYLYAALLLLVIGLAAVLWSYSPGANRTIMAAVGDGEEMSKKLPLTHVVLFNSGVGYFQREGTVEGNKRIDMTFATSDVNDLLKSLMLEDLGGGTIGTVSYDSQEPIEVTLRAFALDLTTNPSFGQLLNQARGEKVEVTTQQGNGQQGTVTGVVVGMESQEEGPNKETHQLNLNCTEGLRCIPLSQVQRVRFLNATLDAEFRRALEVLALSHDNQKKSVNLNFTGEGKRDVRVGYAVENPIWKATYRLVIDKDGKLKLQSWAIVENTTDEDWKDVRLTLVASRPISFKMELYQPLYVPRPTVEPERFASLRPPVFNGSMTTPSGAGMGLAGGGFNIGGNFGGGFQQGFQLGFNQGFNQGGFQNGGTPYTNRYQIDTSGLQPGGRAGPRLSYEDMIKRREELRQARAKAMENGPALAALDPKEIDALMNRDGEEVEDSYQYVVREKATVPRQKSAMLPIINHEVEGTRVSIFNERIQGRNPLLGLRFKNTTDQPLMQGPVFVQEAGRYAGDARIADMQPGEERLLAYAVDGGVEVLAGPDKTWEKVVSVAIRKGQFTSRWEQHTLKEYHIKNRSKQDRILVVEHPASLKVRIVSAHKPYETARDFHRFEVKVAAGKPAVLAVEELRDDGTHMDLNGLNEASLTYYLAAEATTPKIKEVLQQIRKKNQALADLDAEIRTLNEQMKPVVSDQERLRANMDRLPRDSALYKRYLDKLDEQETQLEKLHTAVKAKQELLSKQRTEHEAFLRDLTVE